jgi:hypothetical protein
MMTNLRSTTESEEAMDFGSGVRYHPECSGQGDATYCTCNCYDKSLSLRTFVTIVQRFQRNYRFYGFNSFSNDICGSHSNVCGGIAANAAFPQ